MFYLNKNLRVLYVVLWMVDISGMNHRNSARQTELISRCQQTGSNYDELVKGSYNQARQCMIQTGITVEVYLHMVIANPERVGRGEWLGNLVETDMRRERQREMCYEAHKK
jgi:hypothetical protein